VTENINFLVRLANNAVAADDERHAGGRTRLSDRNAKQSANGAVGIGKQRRYELELFGEALMRCDAVGGDSGDDRAGAGEVGGPPAEVSSFDRSAGGIVFRIRPDDEYFRPSIVVQIDGPRLRFARDLRQTVAWHQRHASSLD
jgi:hypothetical protein